MATIYEFAQNYADEIRDSVLIVRKSAGRFGALEETVLKVFNSISNLKYTDGKKLTPNDVILLLNTTDKHLGIKIGTMGDIVEKSVQSAIAFEEALANLILQIEASGQR